MEPWPKLVRHGLEKTLLLLSRGKVRGDGGMI